MQYVGQTCRALQKRFGEHYRRMKKPKPIDTFLYQHFKLTGHSPNDVLAQYKSEMRSFKSNENIHKKEGGSYYVVSVNKASSVTL